MSRLIPFFLSEEWKFVEPGWTRRKLRRGRHGLMTDEYGWRGNALPFAVCVFCSEKTTGKKEAHEIRPSIHLFIFAAMLRLGFYRPLPLSTMLIELQLVGYVFMKLGMQNAPCAITTASKTFSDRKLYDNTSFSSRYLKTKNYVICHFNTHLMHHVMPTTTEHYVFWPYFTRQ